MEMRNFVFLPIIPRSVVRTPPGSHERALQIRLKLFGENHPDTAESYDYIQLVQDRMKTGVSIRLEQMKSSNFVKHLLRRIFYKSITTHKIIKVRI
jgi:hypothetical protein